MENKSLNFDIVCLEQTEYFKESFRKRLSTGKIYFVFVCCTSVSYNLCELTPSYELRFAYAVTENTLSDNDYDEFIDTVSEDNDMYLHINNYDNIKRVTKDKYTLENCVIENVHTETCENIEAEIFETIEKIVEYERCNHRF